MTPPKRPQRRIDSSLPVATTSIQPKGSSAVFTLLLTSRLGSRANAPRRRRNSTTIETQNANVSSGIANTYTGRAGKFLEGKMRGTQASTISTAVRRRESEIRQRRSRESADSIWNGQLGGSMARSGSFPRDEDESGSHDETAELVKVFAGSLCAG